MARGSARILDDDEEIDTISFMLDACGLDYIDFISDERILSRENLEKNFPSLIKMVENRSFSRAPFFVIGYLILITGAKMSEDLRSKILEKSKFDHEEGRWLDKRFEIERKLYLEDFRSKISTHTSGLKLHPIQLRYFGGKQDLYNNYRSQVIIGLQELKESSDFSKVRHLLL